MSQKYGIQSINIEEDYKDWEKDNEKGYMKRPDGLIHDSGEIESFNDSIFDKERLIFQLYMVELLE